MNNLGLYKTFMDLNQDFDFKIVELSIKQHQATIMFDDQELLFYNDIQEFISKLRKELQKEIYITTQGDVLYLVIPFATEITGDGHLDIFISKIKQMAEKYLIPGSSCKLNVF